jgi:hypothetical protein
MEVPARGAWSSGASRHFSQLGRRGMKFVRIGSCEIVSQGAVPTGTWMRTLSEGWRSEDGLDSDSGGSDGARHPVDQRA